MVSSAGTRDEAALAAAIERHEAIQRGALFPEWDELLLACEEWAIAMGWRFSLAALMEVVPEDSPLSAAQARALPVALEYGDRVKATQCFNDARLLCEFRRCQELVAKEAVHNSMVATCRALGLWDERSEGAGDDCAWEDCSQPLEVIVRRLQNHARQLEAAGLTERVGRRTREASFVVEFGLEHGLTEAEDATSAELLQEFLERVKEWGGDRDNELVRALVLEQLSPAAGGDARGLAVPKSLRDAAVDWFDKNKRTVYLGGALLGGVLGVIAAGAALAVAGAAKSARNSR